MVLRSFALLFLLAFSANCWGQAPAPAASSIGRDLPAGLQVPDAARPGPSFDVDRATEAYIDLLSPEQRTQSDAYFEGGYWLQLWGFLYGLAVSVFLLASGLSRRMRDVGRRVSHRPWLNVAVYAVLWLLLSSLLLLPLAIYADYFREHQYGLSNLSLSGWFVEQLKDLAVDLVIMSAVISGIYSAVRRAGDRWWLRAGTLGFVFILFLMMIVPVFIAPLFNDYKPLPDGPVRTVVLSLARANQIPTDHVEWFDASRQTTRISANVRLRWHYAGESQ